MNPSEIIKNIEAEQLKAEVPEFSVGDTVKVYGKIKEGNRERIQVFEGVVLKKQGGSNRETFTVRKFSNGVGVEKTWPLHSPNVEKVEVVRYGKVGTERGKYEKKKRIAFWKGKKESQCPYCKRSGGLDIGVRDCTCDSICICVLYWAAHKRFRPVYGPHLGKQAGNYDKPVYLSPVRPKTR